MTISENTVDIDNFDVVKIASLRPLAEGDTQ